MTKEKNTRLSADLPMDKWIIDYVQENFTDASCFMSSIHIKQALEQLCPYTVEMMELLESLTDDRKKNDRLINQAEMWLALRALFVTASLLELKDAKQKETKDDETAPNPT